MAEKRKSRGVVVNFHNAKGFGFIKLDGATEEEADIFVHFSQLKSDGYRTLRPGDKVEFLLYKEADKLKAADVVTVVPSATRPGYRGGGGGGGGECYTCGNSGHFARDCYQTTTRGVGNGNGNANASGNCYTCGGVGHMARECPTGRKRGCFTCGGVGHVAADCRNSSSGSFQNGGVRSGSFGRFGGGGVRACFNCGEQGHMAKDCRQDSVGAAGEGYSTRNNCFKCGEPGHFARECISVK